MPINPVLLAHLLSLANSTSAAVAAAAIPHGVTGGM